MLNFHPIFVVGGKTSARQRGWYVQDVQRSTPHALVIVGGRHDSEQLAQDEANRLEAIQSIRGFKRSEGL